jgi:hypothetical protein
MKVIWIVVVLLDLHFSSFVRNSVFENQSILAVKVEKFRDDDA